MTGMVSDRRGVSRRSFLKASAAVGLGAVASPAIVTNAFSSSGELNFMGWAGYPAYQDEFAAFTKETGIKVNFIEQPDQDAMFAQCKLALQTGGIDVVEPTVDRVPAWVDNGLVQPWDMAKIKMDGYVPAFVDGTAGECRANRRQALLPPGHLGHRGAALLDAGESRWNTARPASATCSTPNTRAR